MIKRIKTKMTRFLSDETGQALIMVLVLLLLGSLTLMPVMAHVGTALKTGSVYEGKGDELYAADSGIEDAIWQIKYDRLGVICNDPPYDTYDFNTVWSYNLSELINDLTVNVSIQNVWIPKDVTPLDPAEAKELIELNKLVVAGTATDEDDYRIKVDFYPDFDEGEEDDLLVESLGIWLPYGFSYAGSCNLEEEPYYFDPPTVSNHAGGQAVVWTFSSENFTLFPPGDIELTDFPQTAEIDFKYTANVTGARPVTISWIETSGVDDVPLSWDTDTKIFKITSAARNTEVEAYVSRCELRKMDAAIAGDYKAIGNSNLTGSTRRSTWVYEDGVRKSSTTLNTVPNGNPEEDIGDVIAAYLYWSGSFQSDFTTPIWGPDNCNNWDNWNGPNKYWDINNHRFRGKLYASGTDTRYLEMNNPVNLTGYTPGEVVVEWKQTNGSNDYLESNDGLTFEISSNNGTSWSEPITAFYDYIHLLDYTMSYFYYVLPEEYLTSQFKMRFHLESMTESNEYVDIDDIAVARIIASADTQAKFWINDDQVYLDNGQPAEGSEDIVATQTWVHAFEKPNEYAYTSFLDVTKLVKAYAETVEDDLGTEHKTGNAKYSVGDVNADTGEYRSYAGWSLIIIYSSPETAGHQLYLYEELALNSGYTNLDFDYDGIGGGDITGFVVPEPIEGEEVAATLTCFVGEGDGIYDGDYLIFNDTELSDGDGDLDDVWDSQSIGMSVSGVDIDTFTIYWDDEIIHADDTEAHIDLPTETDNWMLIYMILSVRSKTVTGGTEHYVIRYH
jgi:Flp pilus assembly pilin Flp